MKIDKYLLNFGPAVILTHPGLLQEVAPAGDEVAPPPPPPVEEGEEAAEETPAEEAPAEEAPTEGAPAEEAPAEEAPAEEAPAEEAPADASASLEADARDLAALRWGVRGSLVFTQGTETGVGFQIAGGPRIPLTRRLHLDVDGVFRQLWYPGSPDAATASRELSREEALGMVDDPNDVYAVVPYDAIQGGLLETSNLLDSTNGQQFLVNAALMFDLNESGTLQLGPFLGAGVARRAYERTSDRTVTVRGPTGEDYREEHYGPGEGDGCIPGDDFCTEAPIPEPDILEPGQRHDFVRSSNDVTSDDKWGPLVQAGGRFMAGSADGAHSFVLDLGVQNDVLNGGPEFLATAGYEFRFGGGSTPVRREEPEVEEERPPEVPTERSTAQVGTPIRVPSPAGGWTAGMIVRVNDTDVSAIPGNDPLLIDADLLHEGENRLEVVNADGTIRNVYILTLTPAEEAEEEAPTAPEVVAVERTVTVAGANILVTPGATTVNKGASSAQTIVTLRSDRDATATITLDNGRPQVVSLVANTPYLYRLTADQINAADFAEGAHNVTVRLGESETIYSFPFAVAPAAPAQAQFVGTPSMDQAEYSSRRADTPYVVVNVDRAVDGATISVNGRQLSPSVFNGHLNAGENRIQIRDTNIGTGRNRFNNNTSGAPAGTYQVVITLPGGESRTVNLVIVRPARQQPPQPPPDEPSFGGDAR